MGQNSSAAWVFCGRRFVLLVCYVTTKPPMTVMARHSQGSPLPGTICTIFILIKMSANRPASKGWSPKMGSTTIRLRTFRLRHFVYRHFAYRHFVYYCIPACRTVIHPTSVSANHYFHQFQLHYDSFLSIPLPLTL